MTQHQTYRNYVQHDDDLVGLIAYSLVKAQKIKFAEDNPNTEVQGFVATVNLQKQIQQHRLKAETLLSEMNNELTAKVTQQIQSDADERVRQCQSNAHERVRKYEAQMGFWGNFRVNLASSIATTVIWALGLMLLYMSSVGVREVLLNIIQVKP